MRTAIFNGEGSITVEDRLEPTINEPTDAIGDDVEDLSVGDFGISPFTWSDGSCENCKAGFHSACIHGGVFGQGGERDDGQAEFVRVPQADGTWYEVPGSDFSEETMASLLALTDVMATGYDAGAVMESAGGKDATDTAFAIAGAGAVVGRVGVPHDATAHANLPFFRNVGTRGGPPPARFHQPQLVEAVIKGEINPGEVVDLTVDLDDIAEGSAAMDERRAIKALVKVSDLGEVAA